MQGNELPFLQGLRYHAVRLPSTVEEVGQHPGNEAFALNPEGTARDRRVSLVEPRDVGPLWIVWWIVELAPDRHV